MIDGEEDDAGLAVVECALKWNFAKRLSVENFSSSWLSTLMSTIDKLLSSLHHQKDNDSFLSKSMMKDIAWLKVKWIRTKCYPFSYMVAFEL